MTHRDLSNNTYHLCICFLKNSTLVFLLFYWHFFPKTKHNHRLQIKDKNLLIWSNQEDYPFSEIQILVLKMPHSRPVNLLDWLVTVLLWLSWHKKVFMKLIPPNSLKSTTSRNKTCISMLPTWFFWVWFSSVLFVIYWNGKL